MSSYIKDPTTTPEWPVGMIEVHNVTGSGVGRLFDWTYKLAEKTLLKRNERPTWTSGNSRSTSHGH